MDIPRMTYYAKVIDNLTGEDITNYKNAIDNNMWYYGKISDKGGESQFIVEFDIWNNEPAFNHRNYEVQCKDAKNVRMNIELKDNYKKDDDYTNTLNDFSFFYAKDIINDEGFKEVDIRHEFKVRGNINPNENNILGKGDHSLIQTKIIIPDDKFLEKDRYNFNLVLKYDIE